MNAHGARTTTPPPTEGRGDRRRHGDSGFALVADLVVVVLPVIAILGVIVLAGRIGTVRTDLAGAAKDAARSASLVRDDTLAHEAATQAAHLSLADSPVTCGQVVVDVDTTRFGAGGSVTVTVGCEVQLDDIALPGLPGTKHMTATSTEVIDRYRGTT